jgi:hypothetical protein
VESSCELGNGPSGSIKCWESTEWLPNLWPLEWYSAPQSYLVSHNNLLKVGTLSVSIPQFKMPCKLFLSQIQLSSRKDGNSS